MGVVSALAAEDGMNGGDVALLHRVGTRFAVGVCLDHRRENAQRDRYRDTARYGGNWDSRNTVAEKSHNAGRPSFVVERDLGPDATLEIAQIADIAPIPEFLRRSFELILEKIFLHLVRVECRLRDLPPEKSSGSAEGGKSNAS